MTLCAAFQASLRRVPDRIALRTPGQGTPLTWSEYAAAVQRTAGALAALGVSRGDRVAFLSGNVPELAIAEAATLYLGAAGVALYPTSPAATIEHVLADSKPTVLLFQAKLASHLAEVRHAVAHVLTLDDERGYERLASVAQTAGIDFEATWNAVRPDDLAALIYTSGTTGRAKGVEWSHGAAVASLASFDSAAGEPDGIHDISYAPFAALSERYGGHWHAMLRGSTRTLCEDSTQLPVALLDARPTRLGGPPQVWQRLKQALEATLDAQERAVLQAARAHVRGRLGGEPQPQPSHADQALLAGLRARLGLDRLELAATVAAPCPSGVHEHYHALGIRFLELFAMTEAGVIAAQRPGLVDFGTLGPAVPGYELQIASDCEVLVRSASAPRSYRGQAAETADTYRQDGWIRTGDLGELDVEGRLTLRGRKKEMIIPAHGDNVAPTAIESTLKDACPQITHVCVIGEARPHLVALVVIEEAPHGEVADAESAVAAAVADFNQHCDPWERIEAHAILADPWLPGAELTETLKLRRAYIAERHVTTIEQLYAT